MSFLLWVEGGYWLWRSQRHRERMGMLVEGGRLRRDHKEDRKGL